MVVEGACLLLFGRALQFVASGAPGRLQTLPRRLAYVEPVLDGLAAATGFWAYG
jgi:hypothetical protein